MKKIGKSSLFICLALSLFLLGACSAQKNTAPKRTEKQAQLEKDLQPMLKLLTDKKLKDKTYTVVTDIATTDVKDSKEAQASNYRLDLKPVSAGNGYAGKLNLENHSSDVWYQKDSLYSDEKKTQKLDKYPLLFNRLDLSEKYLSDLDVHSSAKKPDADILEISYQEKEQSENLKKIRKEYALSDSSTATISLKRKYNSTKKYAYSVKYQVSDPKSHKSVEYNLSFELVSEPKTKKK